MTFFVNDGWLRKAYEYDKFAHAGGSCLVTCLLWAILKTCGLNTTNLCVYVCGLTFFLGIALELLQAFRGVGFSWRDLVADAIGIGIAWVAIA